MIVIIAALVGAIIGGMTAKRRKGRTLDILQYLTAYAIAFAVIGFIATMIIERIVV